MKKCMMLMLALMTGTTMFAQHNRGQRKHGDTAEKMKTELGLSDAQHATIKGIDEKYDAKLATLRSDTTQRKEDKMRAFKTVRAEKEKEIAAVLTSEQKTKWDTVKSLEASQRKERFRKGADRYHEHLKESLNLTDEQSANLKSVNATFRERYKALKVNGGADSTALQALKAEHEQAVKNILSEAQFKQWQAKRASMQRKRAHR